MKRAKDAALRPVKAGDYGLPVPGRDGFNFIEAGHMYALRGRRIPSTSGILNLFSPMDAIADTVAGEAGRRRGQRVHSITEKWDRGKRISRSDLGSDGGGYLAAYIQFVRAKGLGGEAAIIEAPIYFKAPDRTGLEYGATLDRILPDLGIAFDIKTGGSYPKRYDLQFQAYLQAVASWGLGIRKLIEVQLRPDGNYKIVKEHRPVRAMQNIFRSGITVWKYRIS